MGTWGPGLYQNDHTLDLLSEEVDQLVTRMEEIFALDQDPLRIRHGVTLAFDDIEGPLLYIHMLSLLAQETHIESRRLNSATAKAWKQRYLDAFNSSLDDSVKGSEYVVERNDVINREFDALIAGLARYESNDPRSV